MSPVDPLGPDALYASCDPARLDFATTAELAPRSPRRRAGTRRVGRTRRRSQPTSAATRARKTGITSAANQGFFRIQAVLRQLGCGSGRNSGA